MKRGVMIDRACKMRKQGLTFTQIGRKLGIGHSTAERWIKDPDYAKKVRPTGGVVYGDDIRKGKADGQSIKDVISYYQARLKVFEKQVSMTDMVVEKLRGSLTALKPGKRFVLGDFKYKADEETLVLMLSDEQIGQRGVKEETGFMDYNVKIFEQELRYLFDTIIYIVELHRASVPIKKLVILFLGDNVENESVFAGQAFQIDVDLCDQLFIGIDLISWFISALAEHFETVETYWIAGNHGRIGKPGEHRYHVTWDYVFAKFVESKLRDHKNVTFTIPKKWWWVATVEGWKILMVHGEDIRRYMKIPWYDTKAFEADYTKMLQSIGEDFTYFCFAHHHIPIQWDSAWGERICNGTFQGYNIWAMKRLRACVRPTQIMFFMHRKVGIASRYLIRLDLGAKRR